MGVETSGYELHSRSSCGGHWPDPAGSRARRCSRTQRWLRNNRACGAVAFRQGSEIQLRQNNFGNQRVPALQGLNDDTRGSSESLRSDPKPTERWRSQEALLVTGEYGSRPLAQPLGNNILKRCGSPATDAEMKHSLHAF